MLKRILAAGIALGMATACSDSPSGPTPPSSLSITSKERFVVTGDTVHIAIDVGGGSSAAVQWESLDPQVATVQDGVVTGVARGNARIVARAGSLSDTARVGVIRNTFLTHTRDACAVVEASRVTVRIAAVSQHAIVLADLANPAGGFTDQEYRQIAQQFDEQVHPVVTGAFGEPLDVDGNRRVIILYTKAVNDLTPAGATTFVGGFFFARDLFPRTQRNVLGVLLGACAGSNEAEMFYMMVPDPARGGPFSKDRVQRGTVSTIAHEFQHLVNASRKLFLQQTQNFVEETWLNEGLSHIAEELMFYRVSGLAPRQNIGVAQLQPAPVQNAFFAYQVENFGRLGEYLENPSGHSPFAGAGDPNSDDGNLLETRGAIWQFLRYAADRRGGNETALWGAFVNTADSGMQNLRNRLGEDPLAWFRDWSISVYADDAGVGAPSQFTQPSWNFRDIFPAFRDGSGQPIYPALPLQTHALSAGTTLSLAVRAGSGAYVRFGVAPGTTARVGVAAGAEPALPTCPGGTAVSLGVGQVFTGTGGTSESLCVSGGAAGAEFVLIPFHASLGQGSLAVSVLADAVVPVLGPPSPSRGLLSLSLQRYAETSFAPRPERGDGAWHARLRELERRELPRLVPGGSPALRPASSMTSSVSGPLSVSIMRTR